MKSFKYRIYPTNKQEVFLDSSFDNCRNLYNVALQHRIDCWRSQRKHINYYDQANELPLLKDDFPQYKDIHSQVLQDVLKRVDLAFQGFFRRLKIKKDGCGFPRFKGEDRFHSITYLQSGFDFTKDKKRIKLSKIGLVKIKLHRDIPIGTKIKTCNIKKEANQWYCILSLEIPSVIVEKKTVANAIGIDLGLTDFAVLSNGEEIKNPKYLRASEKKLKEIHSKYSKGKSKRVKKQPGNLHRKVARQRNDFQHKLSRKLVDTFDLIAYEDLKIKKMVEDNKYNLQKHISDASWGTFIAMIKYKAENAGTYAIAVNPKGTTQKCSNCNEIVPKALHERLHNCSSCGFKASRDVNAALNINKLGINLVSHHVCLPVNHICLSSEAPSPLGKG